MASSACIKPTVGRVDALVFIRRGRSLQRCCSFGAPLNRLGKSLADAVDFFVVVGNFCDVGGNTETTHHSVATNLTYNYHDM